MLFVLLGGRNKSGVGSLEREVLAPSEGVVESVESGREYEVIRTSREGEDVNFGFGKVESESGSEVGERKNVASSYGASERCKEFIKEKEDFGSVSYWDVKHWAIAYGHGGNSRDHPKITREKGEEYFREDLKEKEDAVAELVEVPITQGQYDALVSFTYNFGEGKLKNSTLLRKLNAKNYSGAAKEFDRWVYKYENGKKIKLDGLVAEKGS